MKKFLVGSALVLLLLAGLAGAALFQVTRDTVYLRDYLTSVLGREVMIAGIDEIQPGRQTSFVVTGLSIANPQWAGDSQLLSVDRVRVFLDLLSLVRSGPVVITDLEVSGLKASLLAPEDHPPSWQFSAREAEAAADGDGLQLPVVVQQAHVADATFVFQSPQRELQGDVSGQLQGGEGLKLVIRGQSRGYPLAFNGHVARRNGGLTGSGEGQFEDWLVSLNGTLADPIAFTGLEVQLGIQGSYTLPATEGADAKVLPLQLDMQLVGSGRQLDVQHGLLRSGDSTLSLQGALGNPGNPEGLALQLDLTTPDLKQLLPVARAQPDAVPLSLQGRLRNIGGVLHLDKLRGRSGDARLKGSLQWPLADRGAGAVIDLKGSSASLASLLAPWMPVKPGEDAPFSLDLQALWQPPVWQVEALELEVGSNQVYSQFTLQNTAQRPMINGRLQMSGRRAHHLLDVLGANAEIADDPFMFKAAVSMTEAGAVSVTGLEGQLGSSDVRGEWRYLPGAPASLHAEVYAGKLDLRPMVEAFQRQSRNAEKPDSEGPGVLDNDTPMTAEQLQKRVIPEFPLHGDWLQDLEGTLSVGVGEIILRDDLTSDAEFRFTIADSVLRSEKMQWDGAFSSGSAHLEVRDAAPGLQVSLQLDTRRMPLIWVLNDMSGNTEQASYSVVLAGGGANLRQLAASLNGTVGMRGEGGRLDNRGLMFFFGDIFGEIFAQLNPAVREENFTNIECHAGLVVITDGLVDINPGAVLRTDKLDIVLGGTVDLHDEQLNLVFNTKARTGTGISASKVVTPYLRLGGNLSSPRLGFNAQGLVVSGGAAVATGGLSIVAEGLWDRWISTSVNPCEALFDNADEASTAFKKMLGRP